MAPVWMWYRSCFYVGISYVFIVGKLAGWNCSRENKNDVYKKLRICILKSKEIS